MSSAAKLRWLRLAFTLVVGVLCVFALRHVDLPALLSDLRRARMPLLLLSAGVNLFAIFCRSQRWRALIRSTAPPSSLPSGLRLFCYMIMGNAASVVLPAQGGEGVRFYLLRRDAGVPLATSLGLLLSERLFDLIGLLACSAPLPLILAHPLAPWLRTTIIACAGLGAVAVATALVLALRMDERGPMESTAGSFFLRLGAGLRGVGRPGVWPPALFFTLCAWAADALAVWLVLRALSISVLWATAQLVLLTVSLALIVPAPPGNVGTLEAGAVAGLRAVGVSADPALVFAILYHLIQLLPLILFGLLGLLLLKHSGKAEDGTR